jgi:hypothetical protein
MGGAGAGISVSVFVSVVFEFRKDIAFGLFQQTGWLHRCPRLGGCGGGTGTGIGIGAARDGCVDIVVQTLTSESKNIFFPHGIDDRIGQSFVTEINEAVFGCVVIHDDISEGSGLEQDVVLEGGELQVFLELDLFWRSDSPFPFGVILFGIGNGGKASWWQRSGWVA